MVEHLRKNVTLACESFRSLDEALSFARFRAEQAEHRRGRYVPEAVTLRHNGKLYMSWDRQNRRSR
jgi:hypothetical protein